MPLIRLIFHTILVLSAWHVCPIFTFVTNWLYKGDQCFFKKIISNLHMHMGQCLLSHMHGIAVGAAEVDLVTLNIVYLSI